jgi:F-type H+-transporting ATPase subunit b
MGQTLSQLGQLFVQTIPTILLVVFLLFYLERLLFKPLAQKLQEREAATSGALERAHQLMVEAEEKFRRHEALLQEARRENYHQREQARKKALAEQEEALRKAREQAEKFLHEAEASIAAEVQRATAEIRKSLEPLAEEITGLILNPPVPEDLEGTGA